MPEAIQGECTSDRVGQQEIVKGPDIRKANVRAAFLSWTERRETAQGCIEDNRPDVV